MTTNYLHFQNLIKFKLRDIFIFSIVTLSMYTAFGQVKSEKETIETAYTTYFNPERETIYIHFNKNTFLSNEPIWFKGYVFDKKSNIAFITTTNIYVVLYDSEGNEIETKLFYVKNGTFSGSFDINSSLETGHYYVKAYTNWMKNFKEDESYTSTSIQILNPNSKANQNAEASNDFDLQFLPEGGHSITNTVNSIGFKVINCEGVGIGIEGEIVNSKNESVAAFKSNSLGIGKIDLLMKSGEDYKAKYSVNGKSYTVDLPKSEPIGYTISVNNYTNPNILYINIKTNEETLKRSNDNVLYLAIHQTNKSSVIELPSNLLKLDYTIPIETKNLPSGVNTITIFNDNLEPLVERLFFNYDSSKFLTSNIYIKNAVNDSIPISIHTTEKNNKPVAANLSVSILPSESIAYSNKEDIISAFLIEPYINGYVENPYYYFSNIDRLKKYDLDLLLMTQGWSKYEWKNIKQGEPQLLFPFDKGLSVTGTINEKLDDNSSYQIQMYSFVNNINETTSIDNDNRFYFKNFYLKDSANIKFSILKDGNQVKNPKMYVQLVDNKKTLIKKAFTPIGICAPIEKEITNPSVVNDPFFMEGQQLDTINLFATKKIKEKKLNNEKSYLGNAYAKGVQIDSIAQKTYPFVVDIINANGFNAQQGGGRVSITNRRPISLTSGGSPLLIIDDVVIGNDFDILYNMTLDEIDEIFFNRSGMGYGSRGGGGVISIYRKKGAFYGKTSIQYANQLSVIGGFSTEKKFYIPEFYALSKSDYLNYGAVSWKSNLITDINGNVSFKIRDVNMDKVIVIIQGLTLDGKLLSEIKEISLQNQSSD